jgi:streptomycin 6-kinase
VAMRAGSRSRARDGPCVSQSGLTSPLAAGGVSAMAGFPVPRYPAETAGRVRGVARWIPGLPVIVAGLAGRWSLRAGEPFQPGGQCSWTARVTGPRGDLVLKIASRFPGGEEWDEAAALRVRDGAAAGGRPDRVVVCAADGTLCPVLRWAWCCPSLSRTRWPPGCWRDRTTPTRFRPLTQMCAAGRMSSSKSTAAAAAAGRIDPGLVKAGIALLRGTAADRR